MVISKKDNAFPPMGLWESLVFCGVPMLLLYAATHFGVPALSQMTGLPTVVSWFICGGILVFLPLFVAAFVLYHREGNPWQISAILERFRLNQPTWKVLGWTGLGGVGIGILTYTIVAVGQAIIPGFSAQPAFMVMPPLSNGDRWILAAWIPLFFFNIVGEGLFWRGYVFPRQELAFGQYTWLAHGFCWWIFHLSFGAMMLITLIPITFITSWVVQKTKSTWSDIILHSLIIGHWSLVTGCWLLVTNNKGQRTND